MQGQGKKNTIITASDGSIVKKIGSNAESTENLQETEITAQISVPADGGWAWIVLFSSFFMTFVNDGIVFTFGSVIKVLMRDLGLVESSVGLINSMLVASYFCFGPLVSAFINRFGFRFCSMSGAATCAISLFLTYVSGDYTALLFVYGVGAGFGFSTMNMCSILVVGFYFHKYRSFAFTISATGSSVGIATFYQINTWITKTTDGWRTLFLFQSSLMCLLYFVAMTYRPLLSMTVVQTTEANDPTRTVTYLPTMGSAELPSGNAQASTTERFFNAVSNVNFPTAAKIVEDVPITASSTPGPSTGLSKIKLVASNLDHHVHKNEVKQLKTAIARSQAQIADKEQPAKTIDIVITAPEQPRKKLGFFGRLFHWEKHVQNSRPLYKDDVFYDADIKKLDIKTGESKNALDYQLKVSRAAAASDLRERRGICTTAFRRVLSTMLDFKILKRKSFLMLCAHAVFLYTGYLIPMVFVASRGESLGIAKDQCSLLVSVIAVSGIFGRFFISIMSYKLTALRVGIVAYFITGAITFVSGFLKTMELQITYCVVFGVGVSGLAIIRSLIFVDLYGLEKLTNCTGMFVLFAGIGALISTPTGGLIIKLIGYQGAFFFSGGSIILSSICLIPVGKLVKKENGPELGQVPRVKSRLSFQQAPNSRLNINKV